MKIAKVAGLCPYCNTKLRVKQLKCPECNITIEGDLTLSNLASLSSEQQHFIEIFVLSNGNLKDMANKLGVSYPTLRRRLDSVIEALSGKSVSNKEERSKILDEIEEGKITPEEAAKLIKALG